MNRHLPPMVHRRLPPAVAAAAAALAAAEQYVDSLRNDLSWQQWRLLNDPDAGRAS